MTHQRKEPEFNFISWPGLTETKFLCEKDIETTTLLVSFPAPGLAGVIAAKYLVDTLKLPIIGYINCPLIPPVSIFLDGILQYPYRIYGSKKLDLIVFIGEAPTPLEACYLIIQAALNWAENIAKIREVICLGGFPVRVRNNEPEIYLVTKFSINNDGKTKNLPLLEQEYIGLDLVGAVFNESVLRNINSISYLVNTTPNLFDPIGAAKLVEHIALLKNIEIDIKPLLEEGERTKEYMEDFTVQTDVLTPRQYSSTDMKLFYT